MPDLFSYIRMVRTAPPGRLLSAIALLAGMLSGIPQAQAVPGFARQTGLACTVCHVTFPELTPFGREFKLSGYTLTNSASQANPIAALLQVSATRTSNRKGADPSNFLRDGGLVLQQASLFYAGKLTDKSGAFVQWTYDGVQHHSGADNMDFRYADKTTLGGRNLIYGLTLNNSPTVQDVWNSTPVWGFPYASSSVSVSPAASTLLQGTLAAQSAGLGAYAFWDRHLYGELSFYTAADHSVFQPLSAGSAMDARIKGTAPYFRVAAEHTWDSNSVSAGALGMIADILQDPLNPDAGSNRLRDVAVDMQFQHLGDPHAFTAQAIAIRERQDQTAALAAGDAANRHDTLRSFKIKGTYLYQRKYGASLGYFATSGSQDSGLYQPAEVTGSASGKPDSSGYIAELYYLPTMKSRITLQYTGYNKFNGGRDNYDGFGRNARDNNTLYLNGWLMF